MKFRELRRLRDEGRIHSFKIVGEQKHWPTPIQAGLSYEIWVPPMEAEEEAELRREISGYLETDPGLITFVTSLDLPSA